MVVQYTRISERGACRGRKHEAVGRVLPAPASTEFGNSCILNDHGLFLLPQMLSPSCIFMEGGEFFSNQVNIKQAMITHCYTVIMIALRDVTIGCTNHSPVVVMVTNCPRHRGTQGHAGMCCVLSRSI